MESAITLTSDTTCAAHARDFVDDRLRDLGLVHLSEVARLLTSELVSNAVVHGAETVRIAVAPRDDAVRIEVASNHPELPVRHRFAEDPELGRGMAIVEAVAMSWGVDRQAGTKTAWFELSSGGREA
jgi:anti-sigma regulatory factor (Ser/Thr protein kinase)